MSKKSVIERISDEIRKVPVDGKTSYKIISDNLGWKGHCGKQIHKFFKPHWEGYIEERRDGKKMFIHILKDPNELCDIVLKANPSKNRGRVKGTKIAKPLDRKVAKKSADKSASEFDKIDVQSASKVASAPVIDPVAKPIVEAEVPEQKSSIDEFDDFVNAVS